MANYELMLIVNPNISEEDRTKTLDNVKALLKKNSAKIVKEDIWWDKKLAYKINKSERAFYALFNLELDWTKIKDMNSSLNLEKNLWRYMFVKQEEPKK